GDERLRGKVVALVEFMAADDVENAGIAFQAGRMQRYAVEQVLDAGKASLRIFQRHPSHQPMHFVSEIEQVLSQVTAVLARQTGNQNSSGHTSLQARGDSSE